MPIKIPWPDDPSPEEIRRREQEREERIRHQEQQQRQDLEAAVANRDVVAMAAFALDAIGRISDGTRGITWRDIDDLGRLATELAVEGALLRPGGFRHLLALSSVLKVKGNALRGTAPDRELQRLLAAASIEMSELAVTAQAQARAHSSEATDSTSNQDDPGSVEVGEHPSSRSGPRDDQAGREAHDPDAKVTVRMMETETGFPYSTLTSRRLRLPESERPQPIGKDDTRSDLYRRGDWDDIISSIRRQRGISDSEQASDA